MSEVTTIGLDITKNAFHAHGADERGRVVFSKRISRGKPLEFSLRSRVAWSRSKHVAVLIIGAPADPSWSRGAPDPANLCEAVREAA